MTLPRLCPYGFQLCVRQSGCTPFPDGLKFGEKPVDAGLVDNCPDRIVAVHMAAYQQGPPSVRAMQNCDHCSGRLLYASDGYGSRDVCESCGCAWDGTHPYQFVQGGTRSSCKSQSPTRPPTAAGPVQ